MGFDVEHRASDSPLVEMVMEGRTIGSGETIRPAENHWHLVLVKQQGVTQLRVVGPWSTAGRVRYLDDTELLWIKLKLGTFMPHLPTKYFLNSETPLPAATRASFWLQGSAWQFPNYENADTFVSKLVRENVLVHDEVIGAALGNKLRDAPDRTIRHHFLHATGLSQGHIRKLQRAQKAADLLRRGTPILDTVYELGYYDQPHLTRSLKQFIGYTPAQLLRPASTE
jgi:hypothetical protein